MAYRLHDQLINSLQIISNTLYAYVMWDYALPTQSSLNGTCRS